MRADSIGKEWSQNKVKPVEGVEAFYCTSLANPLDYSLFFLVVKGTEINILGHEALGTCSSESFHRIASKR